MPAIRKNMRKAPNPSLIDDPSGIALTWRPARYRMMMIRPYIQLPLSD
jgi:hypothetical protein